MSSNKMKQAPLNEVELASLRNSVESGLVGAISIDTSYFQEKRWNFDRGVLKRLEQFNGTPISVVLSSVIVAELHDHMITDADTFQRALVKSLGSVGNNWGISDPIREEVIASLFRGRSPKQVVEEKVALFIERVEAAVIKPDEYCGLSEVLERYFEKKAPFGGADKKSEFPDAFALLSLEAWAAKHDTKMIVVSADGDWRKYCAESQRLIFVPDLPIALSCFHRESASYFLADLLVESDRLDLRSLLAEKLSESQDLIDFDVEASSQFNFETEVLGAELTFVEIQKINDKNHFNIIESSEIEVIAQLHLTVEAEIHVKATFHKWDSVDKEYVPMGSETFYPLEEVDMEAVLTLEKVGDKFSVQEIELAPTSYVIELGDIEPDWRGESGEGAEYY